MTILWMQRTTMASTLRLRTTTRRKGLAHQAHWRNIQMITSSSNSLIRYRKRLYPEGTSTKRVPVPSGNLLMSQKCLHPRPGWICLQTRMAKAKTIKTSLWSTLLTRIRGLWLWPVRVTLQIRPILTSNKWRNKSRVRPNGLMWWILGIRARTNALHSKHSTLL